MSDREILQSELDWLLSLIKRANVGSVEIPDTLKREIASRIGVLQTLLGV
jgi:hypothetical protein